MKKGDKIVSLNGTKITNTNSLLTIINLSKSNDGYYNKNLADKYLLQLKEINFVFTEDEVIPKGVTVKLPEREAEPSIGLQKEEEVGIVKPENNDEKLTEVQAKIRDSLTNDKYITGNEQFTLRDLSKAMADNTHPLNFVVDRDGKYLALKAFNPDDKGKIGVQLESKEVLIKTQGIKSILKYGTKYLYDNTYYMVYGLGQIFTGKVPLKDLHGIVAITKVGGDIIQNSGLFYGLLLTAIISMDLAIVNFLPIPALDGGHILFLIIEKIRGRRLKDETVEKIGTVFFSLLIILMVLIIFNDIIWLRQ